MTSKQYIEQIEKEIGFKLRVTEFLTNSIFKTMPINNSTMSYEEKRILEKNDGAFVGLKNNQIVELVIQNCNIVNIPDIVLEIETLRTLSFSKNNLHAITQDFKTLKNLEVLDISNNSLTEIPKSILELKNLIYLDLSNNKIENIPIEVANLNKLNSLILSKNLISNMPYEIIGLESLWACNKNLIEVTFEKNTVVKNQRYELAAKLRDKEKSLYNEGKIGINIDQNEIENLPPELVRKGLTKVMEYWHSIKEGNTLPLNEFKLILVGEGGSGKTSLLKRITSDEFDENEKQTHGINIKSWLINSDSKNITANIWDFGGQEIMHSTHQFFLSERSMYIVVIDSRKEEKIEYWLKHIEVLAASSPTIIIINKIDENPGFDINRKFLLEKYNNIAEIIKISCRTGEGLDALNNSIKKNLDKVSHLNTLWPINWFEIKSKLENTNENYINMNSFKMVCEEVNVYSKSQQNTLLDFLHDLGVMLHFKDFDLFDTNVLNPHWVTEGVYKIINSQELAKKSGVLSLNLLRKILEEYSYQNNQLGFFISLMQKFELCYIINRDEMLIPDLLSVQEPEFNIKADLEFYFKYNFLPRSIFPKLIVRLKSDVVEHLAWRTGVVLENANLKCKSKIIIDYEEKIINIKISGVKARKYFEVIYHTLSDINNTFQNISISERIPIQNGALSVNYQHLIKLEDAGIFSFIPEGMTTPIDVSETLGAVTKSKKEKIEDEILLKLSGILYNMSDKKSLINEANKILELKPNIIGIGININAIVDKIFNKKKNQ